VVPSEGGVIDAFAGYRCLECHGWRPGEYLYGVFRYSRGAVEASWGPLLNLRNDDVMRWAMLRRWAETAIAGFKKKIKLF
jgi:hypothetical protein